MFYYWFLSSFWKKPCNDVGVAFVGILLLKDDLPHSLIINWLLEKKSIEILSLEVHRIIITRFAWLERFRFKNHTCCNLLCVFENFSKSYWVYIHNVKDFFTKNHLSFFRDKDHNDGSIHVTIFCNFKFVAIVALLIIWHFIDWNQINDVV